MLPLGSRKEVRHALIIVAVAALLFTSTAVLLLAVQHLVAPALIWVAPSLEPSLFDLGLLGAYRTQNYVSFNLTSPKTNVVTWGSPSCGEGFVLLDPNGPSVGHSGPLIIDASGNLVWTSDRYRVTTNSKIQTYRGEEYLTFWSGAKAKTSGTGMYYMLDSNYTEVYKFDAVGDGKHGDLHEFKITKDNTALITVYTTVQIPDAPFGFTWVTDNLFQELDIETGELLFEWRASDHFRPGVDKSYMTNPIGGYTKQIPFDFFHLNSVEKDSNGDYLISSRHFHAIYLISGSTAEILWSLGGRASGLTDLSDGGASDFSWQHDVRWLSEEDGIVSLFDNRFAWPHSNGPFSRVLILQVDKQKQDAKLLHEIPSVQKVQSSSQGSVQRLPASPPAGEPSLFVGWGSSATFSQFSMEGQLLCETNFASPAFFWWERVKSYRAYKTLSWPALPAGWDPSAKIKDGRLYVSWNGANTVAFWQLEGCNLVDDSQVQSDEDWEGVGMLLKKGQSFESTFSLPLGDDSYTHYRVTALDENLDILRYSNIAGPEMMKRTPGILVIIVFLIGCVGAVVFVWLFKRKPDWRQFLERAIDRTKYQKLR